jgi:hypothetical protein
MVAITHASVIISHHTLGHTTDPCRRTGNPRRTLLGVSGSETIGWSATCGHTPEVGSKWGSLPSGTQKWGLPHLAASQRGSVLA